MAMIRGKIRPEKEIISRNIVIGESIICINEATEEYETASGQPVEMISYEEFLKLKL